MVQDGHDITPAGSAREPSDAPDRHPQRPFGAAGWSDLGVESVAGSPVSRDRLSWLGRPGRGDIVRWVAAGVIAVVGLSLLGSASSVTASGTASLGPGIAAIAAAQERIDAVSLQRNALPADPKDALRWLAQAQVAGTSVADDQNAYLDNTGPLSLVGIPTTDPTLNVLHPVSYTVAQRTALAAAKRASAVSGLSLALAPFFAPTSAVSGTAFDVNANWALRLPSVDTGNGKVSLAGYSWSFVAPASFFITASVPALWLLHDPRGVTVGWLRGFYDPMAGVFWGLVLGSAAGPGNSTEAR